MKTIAFVLLVACSLLAGCSRPTAEATVANASPTPRELTEEQKRWEAAAAEAAQEKKKADAEQASGAQPAVPMTEAAIKAQPPATPASTPKP